MAQSKYYLYETLEGDTFDSIALDFYNNEYYSSKIINSNLEYATTLIFKSGIKLKVPLMELEDKSSTLPPWKR